MRLVYVAEDGSEFENEKECERYEARQEKIFSNLPTFVNADLEEIHHNVYDGDRYEEAIYDSTYMIFRTPEQVDSFHEMCDDQCWDWGHKEITHAGIYAYDEAEQAWINYKDFYEQIQSNYEALYKMAHS